MNSLPLSGLLVVSLEQFVCAPICSRNLSDLGARVIKVERPGEGDLSRNMDSTLGPWSSVDLMVHPGKESLTLNVKDPRAIAILFRLLERADILLENLRPGMADEMGLHYEVLTERNPRLIYCQISGYGQEGPYGQKKAMDYMMQGESGLISITGTPEAPSRVGAAICDAVAGLYASTAVLGALHQVRETGRGRHIDLSMLESTIWMLCNIPYRYWHRGDIPERSGMRHPYYSPYGVYETSDSMISIAVASAGMWAGFCKAIKRTELIDDPRFASVDLRSREHRATLDAIIQPILRERTSEQWIEELERAKVPCGLVRTIPEVLAHPQFEHRDFINEIQSDYGPVKSLNFPARFEGLYPKAQGLPPLLGADTDAILSELGYSDAEIELFHTEGVV